MANPLTWRDTANLPPLALQLIADQIAIMMPREAVGLLWESPGNEVGHRHLANISDDPEHSYAVNVSEMIAKFEAATGRDILRAMDDGVTFTLWHSHPSGLVGPSRGDVRLKQEALTYMVVTVNADNTLTATLF